MLQAVGTLLSLTVCVVGFSCRIGVGRRLLSFGEELPFSVCQTLGITALHPFPDNTKLHCSAQARAFLSVPKVPLPHPCHSVRPWAVRLERVSDTHIHTYWVVGADFYGGSLSIKSSAFSQRPSHCHHGLMWHPHLFFFQPDSLWPNGKTD